MPQETLMTIAAVITAVGVIIGALIAIYRVARRIGDAIGVDSKGRTLAERLDRVEHQLWENGGSSLADRVNNIDKSVTSLSAELKLITTLVTASAGLTPEVEEIKPKRTRAKKAV
jgi:hypothetical protein